mmetsp:Transcript_38022/g.75384  ORF Transcript_38022/g.75384 Transcript_38022/m.75384 type:complete len:138 (+) Transcript_38022:815-1228(+)
MSFRNAGKISELQKKSFCLPSGAKAFVHPEQYDAALKEAEFKYRLIAQHVLASLDYEPVVQSVIRAIPANRKIGVPRRKSAIPLGCASEAASLGINFKIERTFIHVKIPSSLRSSSSGQACVASSTEVHIGKNPRRA